MALSTNIGAGMVLKVRNFLLCHSTFSFVPPHGWAQGGTAGDG